MNKVCGFIGVDFLQEMLDTFRSNVSSKLVDRGAAGMKGLSSK